MKNRIILIALAALVFFNVDASSFITIGHPAKDKTVLHGNPVLSKEENTKLLQMRLLAGMTLPEYEKLKGKKLSIPERFMFRISQHRMKKMMHLYKDGYGPTTLQKISWLLKGLILGPIALILGYLLLRDDDRELIKWIWFGFAGFVAIILLALLAA